MTTDLELLVREITNNARAMGMTFSRADAIAHIRVHQVSLVREGRIPENSQLQDTDKGLIAVES